MKKEDINTLIENELNLKVCGVKRGFGSMSAIDHMTGYLMALYDLKLLSEKGFVSWGAKSTQDILAAERGDKQ